MLAAGRSGLRHCKSRWRALQKEFLAEKDERQVQESEYAKQRREMEQRMAAREEELHEKLEAWRRSCVSRLG